MIHLPRDKKSSFFLLLILLGFVVVGMLYFGLRMKGFRPKNNVKWAVPGPGLIFNRYSVAYTKSFFHTASPGDTPVGLTIELAIKPSFPRYSRFRYLVLVHNGDEQQQLVIGQYRTSLIIMNGNDYSNKQRLPKIYANLNHYDTGPHLLTIVSNELGTKLFIDGELTHTNSHLTLRYPDKTEQMGLVIGNSLAGNNPWVGKILGLALYDNDVGKEIVHRHYHQWRLQNNFDVFGVDGPRLLYTFDEGKGEIVHNKTGDGQNLAAPTWMKVLHKKVLSFPAFENLPTKSLKIDISLNLIGFIPLGFLLFMTLEQLKGIGNRDKMVMTVLLAFLFSLLIEIVQVWIPSRDSSMLDLFLNTLGSYLGVLLFKLIQKCMYYLPGEGVLPFK